MSNSNQSSSISKPPLKTYSIKLLTIGEGSVGKTSIISKLCTDTFDPNQLSTTGIDFRSFTLNYNQDTKVNVSLWDTAGQGRYHNISRQYFSKVNGMLLVYDITSRNSFEKITKWTEDIIDTIGSLDEIGFVLLGNKNDLQLQRVVSKEEGKERAKELGIPFFETSAKTGCNLKESIAVLSQKTIELIEKGDKGDDKERGSIVLKKEKEKDKSNKDKDKCCK
jgi:Ras-related protein Rab-8A